MKKSDNGLVLSPKKVYKDPVNIFSNPSAITQLLLPLLIALCARNRAVLPVEQLLFTLMTGIPDIPTEYTAFYPQQESPYT